MTGIDERVVSMKFNNGQFLNGIAATLNAMANLKKGLDLKGASKGVDTLGSSMSKLPPPAMAQGIQGLSGKFLALSTVGITALSNITTAALAAGSQLVKSLTIDPVKQGLEEYETLLNSVQTIMANTGLEGEKGLGKVNGALEELNTYADQTIYNFSEMAKNIGTFTAAGVDLDTSTEAIKGIANLAAISGSNAQQASTAMYQLSQSLSSGKVTLEDWNSVVNAGLGGKVFQDAIKETARVHGVAVDDIIKEEGSFRNSLQEGWITSEILTETLSKFTGDLSKKQLKAMGYNDEQIKGIVKMGKTASDAATKVKTMSQLIGTLQEAAQSGWAKTWQTIFGDFDEAKSLFTDVNDVLGGMVGASADSRNKMLSDWKDLGGRTVIIEAIGTAFNNIVDILKPVREAFRDIFPPTTGKQLFAITEGLLAFSKTIKMGAADSKNLKSTFAGLFAIFSIAGQIIKGVFTTLGELFGVVSQGGSGFLEITGNIGDFLVKLDEAMKKGDGLTAFFEGLGKVLAVPIQLIGALGAVIATAFGGLDEGATNGIGSALERIGARLEPFAAMGDLVAKAWSGMGDVLKRVWDFMSPFADAVANIFGSLGQAIADSVSQGDFSIILDTLNTGLFAVIALAIRKFLADGSIFNFGDAGGGFLEGITEAFGGLTDTLSAMQANLKAGTLIKIAGAVALLTASVVGLSLIDSGSLTKALTALTVMFIQLGGAMAAFEAISSVGSVLKLAPMAAGLILLATSIVILTAAVKVLSTMSWEELGKGLAGVAALLISLSVAAKLMAGGSKGLSTAAVGMIAMAVAVRILASSVKVFAAMSWADIGKGLAGVAGALLLIAGAMQLMPKNLPLTGAGLLIVSGALLILSGALKIMAGMSWEEIAKGLVVLAGSLAILAGAMYLMTAAIPGALAMLIIAPALVVLASALLLMASTSWEEIGKMMTVLAGSLLILAGGMYLMTAALPGALALIVVAGALAILTPALIAMGNMSWEEIGKGLTMLAGALGIIGLAGLVLTPVIPTLLGLGAAIALLGIGTLAAGAGLLAFSAGLTALSISGAASVAAIIAIVSGLIGLIPMAMKAVGEGIVLMAEVIGGAGPQFVVAMTTLMNSLLTAIGNVAPKVINLIWSLVVTLANRVADGYPKLVAAGMRLITGVLSGIGANVGKLVTAATSVIVNFINALSSNLPRITDAGANMIITLVNSLANSISTHSADMRAAGQNLAFAIVDGMTGGLLSGASNVISAAVDMASGALAAAKDVLGIHSPSREFAKIGRFAAWGFANGLTGDRRSIGAAVKAMKSTLADAIRSTNEDVKKAEERYKKLTSARNKDTKAIARARKQLAQARKENRQARSARRNLVNNLDDEERALKRLATRYAQNERRLDSAKKKLKDMKQVRADYVDSVRDQYSDLGQIEGKNLKGFTTSLRTQVKQTQEYARLLQTLRKRGLNDKLYKELLSRGPDALPLVRNIVQGGKTGVKELNRLTGQLNRASNSLGKTAGKSLYNAGVNAAAGLVKGLQKREKAIAKVMDRIAQKMVKSIKKRLGIRSPSRELAKVGVFTAEGLIKGIDSASNNVNKAASKMGSQVVDVLSDTLSSVGKNVDADMDMTPVVRPVLDLTEVKKGASKLPGIMPRVTVPIDPTPTANIGLPGRRFRPSVEDYDRRPEEVVTNVTNVSMEQNITSPKALSEVELYRQTKNMVSTVKGRINP